MKQITIATMKGGDGKSTIGINLASIFAGKGKNVFLSDSDVNRHCIKWYERAKLNPKYDPNFSVAGIALMSRYLSGCDLMIMDTMANIQVDQLKDYADASDLVVIPMRPSIDSYGPVIETVEAVKDICQYRILMNACPTRSTDADEFIAEMQDDEFQFFKTKIRQSIGIPRASLAGVPVSEMTGNYKSAAGDFEEVCDEITGILEI